MKKNILMVVMSLIGFGLFSADNNPNWDGIFTCKIRSIDITGGNNFDLRIGVTASDALNDTNTPHDNLTWVYLNERDANYKSYLSMLMLAFTMDYNVTFYIREVPRSGTTVFGHIGYIVVKK